MEEIEEIMGKTFGRGNYYCFLGGIMLILTFVAPSFSQTPVGKEIPFLVPKSEATKAASGPHITVEGPPEEQLGKAKSIQEVAISANSAWVKVIIKGDGPMPEYKSFQLARPSRLVLDIPKIVNASQKKNIDVGNPLLKDIRIGQHPEKVRLVFTFPGTKIPTYQMLREGQEVTLVLGQVQVESLSKDNSLIVESEKSVQSEEVEAAEPVKKKEETPIEVKEPEEQKAPVTSYKGARLSLDFKDADIHNIFRLIAEVSNLNIITAEDVKGKITIRMINIPCDQALDVILATKNLVRIDEGNVVRITTMESVRKEREERQKEEEVLLKTRDTKLKLEEPGRRFVKVNYADATELQKLLLEKKDEGKGFLGPQGSVKADKRTNTLIIQDIRGNLDKIEQVIRELDSPTPQVLIEARVVQGSNTFARSLGIQWGGSYNQTGGGWAWGLTGNDTSASAGWGFTPSSSGAAGTQLSMPSNFVVNYPAATTNTSTGGFGISFGKLTGSLVNLDLRLSLGETDSQVKVIARPKLATLDNYEALIKQGEKIPYETTSQAGTQVQFIDAVLMLKVTPHITPDGSILTKITVTRDARGSFRSATNQVPSIDSREVSTEVLVKDAETLVTGGIYETDYEVTSEGIPWLMHIPVLGWLFKNQDILNTKKELLIFITPTVIQSKIRATKY
jgi:type IV pilus secretin PilQ/predicted competence protein